MHITVLKKSNRQGLRKLHLSGAQVIVWLHDAVSPAQGGGSSDDYCVVVTPVRHGDVGARFRCSGGTERSCRHGTANPWLTD